MFCKSKCPEQIKLIDFGESLFHGDRDISDYCIGSAYYMAPELITKDSHDKKIDMWSIGVMAYFILSGDIPFAGEDLNEIYVSIVKDDYEMPEEYWGKITPVGKSFVASLLNKDPEKRLSAEEAMNHPWIKDTNY